MQREVLLVAEIIDAAERIVSLTSGATVASLDADRDRREALLWSFTVLGEASGQLDEDLRSKFPHVQWRAATALRNRIVHGYWQISTSILLTTGQDDRSRRTRLARYGAGLMREDRRVSHGRLRALVALASIALVAMVIVGQFLLRRTLHDLPACKVTAASVATDRANSPDERHYTGGDHPTDPSPGDVYSCTSGPVTGEKICEYEVTLVRTRVVDCHAV